MNKQILLCSLSVVFFAACARNTGDKPAEENTVQGTQTLNEDPMNITAEDPFRNQPNALCTIIRKIGPAMYGGNDMHAAEKYCLLDICIDNISNSDLTINLGDESTMINTYFAVIKVFGSVDEAKQYAEQYHIQDVVFTD